MRNLTRITLFLIVGGLVWPSLALAQEPAADANTILLAAAVDILILLVSLICCLFAAQLYQTMKGGEMMFAWRFLAAGVLLFAIAQVIEISDSTLSTKSPIWFIPAIRLIFIIFIMLGFRWQKKALS